MQLGGVSIQEQRNKRKLKIDLSKISEVCIGRTEIPGYDCPNMKCMITNGYISLADEKETGMIVYLDCFHDDPSDGSCKHSGSSCPYLQGMLEYERPEGNRTVMHMRGDGADLMADIIDEFEESDLKELRLPIRTNQRDENTYPEKIKRSFVFFKGTYETELEPEVIEKLRNNEFVEKYVLTVRKVGEPKVTQPKECVQADTRPQEDK